MKELLKVTLSEINAKDFGILLFYSSNCKYCEQIKPTFEAYAEQYPQLQFAKIEASEGLDYYMQYAEENEDKTKKVALPSFYVHHKAAVSPENPYGFVGGFDGASEEELKAVCENIAVLS